MNRTSLLVKILMALAGCIAGAYVGQELLKGGALGWAATGAITAALAWPLFQTLIEWRNRRS